MKSGAEWEDYVHYVFNILLNVTGERVQVSKRAVFVIKPNETYEIDVYYEFRRAGVRHRVAIECKDWKRPIDQGQILLFHQKIKNIGDDLVGVMVARNGCQAGACQVADRHGILILTEESIPSLPQLLVKSITSQLIHEPGLVGEPFWCIAELSNKMDGQSTGTYCAFPKSFPFNIPLFVSSKHAEAYRSLLPDAERFAVFALPQHKLRGLIGFAYMHRLTFAVVYASAVKPREITALPISLDAQTLKEDFLLLDFPKNLERFQREQGPGSTDPLIPEGHTSGFDIRPWTGLLLPFQPKRLRRWAFWRRQ